MNNSSNTTKEPSYLSRKTRRLRFWLRWPLIWLIVTVRNLFIDSEKQKLYNVKWDSIDEMPIHNWNMILQTGDLKYLFKTEGIVGSKANELWLRLQQDYINEFGLDDTYMQLLRLQKKLTLLNLDYVITKDRFLFNLITMAEKDIESLAIKEGMKFIQLLNHVEKYMGYRIDPKDTSVKRWYSALKNMSENNG